MNRQPLMFIKVVNHAEVAVALPHGLPHAPLVRLALLRLAHPGGDHHGWGARCAPQAVAVRRGRVQVGVERVVPDELAHCVLPSAWLAVVVVVVVVAGVEDVVDEIGNLLCRAVANLLQLLKECVEGALGAARRLLGHLVSNGLGDGPDLLQNVDTGIVEIVKDLGDVILELF